MDLFHASLAKQLIPNAVSERVANRVSAAETEGVHNPDAARDLAGTNGKGGRQGAFAETFGDRQAAIVTAREIELLVNEKCRSDANKRETLMRSHGLFVHTVKRRHIAVTSSAWVEMPRPSVARAAILTVTKCTQFLLVCPERSLPAVAVQLFAGLRHAEAGRLTWEQVSFEGW